MDDVLVVRVAGPRDVLDPVREGIPTEEAGHEVAVLAQDLEAPLPMRVMIRIETATYDESVI